ncbi:TIGR02453 family protein [Pelobium manganitolerans]|uniref:TIGR02453 family protein n=1 Tax=Pelobium manganitolerans TaxID=1842495 RepID=A0A419S1S6_9SPHI|nr:DUF2461 domain-containing protein [Pelobium manganitolerans]RKD12449.1 TIGR02453 family protein [Pelobium manganitolerans]
MIKAETFLFLTQLQQNNNREWFLANKEQYLSAKENVEVFADEIIAKFRKLEPRLADSLTGKKSVMRIYRDVRFSKDKSPYKTNFGISLSTTPKGIHGPGYFVQLQPGQSFVAGGMWMPEAAHLKLIRQEVDYNGDKFLAILNDTSFKRNFGNSLNNNEKLKTTPKGYDAMHPQIELLKLKSFTVSRVFDDQELQSKKSVESVVACLKEIMPFNAFLAEAIDVNED